MIDQSQLLFDNSTRLTRPLVDLILQQSTSLPFDVIEAQSTARCKIHQELKQSQSVHSNELFAKLPASLQRSMEVASESGASTWLSLLPIQEHGFALHKGAFRDALCLCYGWQPNLLPSTCVCGKTFSIEHALNCPCGGYPSIRHNELRDITASLLTEVCHSVGTEPCLQPLSSEFLKYKTANDADDARVDIVAENFWCCNRQKSYLDVKVFNPFAKSYVKETLTQCYRHLEKDKKRAYEARVREVELGCFTPLVFSTSGGLGPAARTFYKRLASLIAEKHDQLYSLTLFWLCAKSSFSLLRSAIMCLRGSRSSYHQAASFPLESAIDLTCSASRNP